LRQTRLALLSLVLAVAPTACSKQPAAEQPPATAAQPAAAPTGQMAPAHTPSTVPPSTESATAPSSVTPIADVWKNRKALAGKTVTVQGKVVKFNGGILGRNWVHVQDGSGTADDKTNDLTITTSDEVAVGDQVVASGVVGIDRDFTAGYAYPVMIENGRVTRK
jgi:hypothetical protein